MGVINIYHIQDSTPKTKTHPAQSVNSVEVEKPCSYQYIGAISFSILNSLERSVLLLPPSYR
jgi:hypothetical protein